MRSVAVKIVLLESATTAQSVLCLTGRGIWKCSQTDRKLRGMGYEDRDYMRGGPSGPSSNPLWWILGLIAVVVVFAALRRGSLSPSGQWEEVAVSIGPVRICEIDFAVDTDRDEALLPLLRSFFRQHGYDSTIHESADGSRSTAVFARQSSDGRVIQNVSYQQVRTAEATGQATRQLQCQVLRIEAAESGDVVVETLLLIDELRMKLEQELPGIVTRFDNEPKPVTYRDLE
jgi:hypothetical protein